MSSSPFYGLQESVCHCERSEAIALGRARLGSVQVRLLRYARNDKRFLFNRRLLTQILRPCFVEQAEHCGALRTQARPRSGR